jgi:excisionase family DNA binding protein
MTTTAMKAATPDPRWATVQEAAEHTSLAPNTIRRMLARKELRKFKPTPRRVLIDLHELDQLIQSKAV